MKNKILIWLGSFLLVVIIAIVIFFTLKPNTYKVTFKLDAETVFETQKVKDGKSIEEPSNPTKDGYTFLGWYLDGQLFDFKTEITKSIELEAKWAKVDAVLHTVTFNSNGGTKVNSMQVEKNTVIGTLPTTERENYVFDGWYIGSKKVTSDTLITNDVTLIARWEKEEANEKTTKKTTKKTTTKKATTTTTTKVTTKKETTTATTTTKASTTTTTTTKKDVISYVIEPLQGSVVGQARLYLTKNGTKVAGTCTVKTKKSTAEISVPAEGYSINSNNVVSVTNIKIN